MGPIQNIDFACAWAHTWLVDVQWFILRSITFQIQGCTIDKIHLLLLVINMKPPHFCEHFIWLLVIILKLVNWAKSITLSIKVCFFARAIRSYSWRIPLRIHYWRLLISLIFNTSITCWILKLSMMNKSCCHRAIYSFHIVTFCHLEVAMAGLL